MKKRCSLRNPFCSHVLHESPTRRSFLVSSSGYALAIPLLSSLTDPKIAQAATSGRRFLAIFCGHGQFANQWHPNPRSISWVSQSESMRYANLPDISGDISPIFDSNWNALRDKITLMRGISYSTFEPNHNSEAYLSTAARSGNSTLPGAATTIDHLIADHFGQSALNLTVPFSNVKTDKHTISLRNSTQVSGQINPSVVFKMLFPEGQNTNGFSGGGNLNRLNSSNRRKAIDLVLREFNALRNNSKLSSIDKLKLEEHFDSLSEFQGKLLASESENTSPPADIQICKSMRGPADSPISSSNNSGYETLIDQNMQLIELAIKCGDVRSITLQLHPYDYATPNVLNLEGDFHTTTGHGGNAADKLKLMRFYGQKISELLKKLDVEESNGQTYLDNSLALWFNDQGASGSPGDHGRHNLPTMIAGSAGGFVKSGRYIDYGKDLGNSYPSSNWGSICRPVNQVLMTILAGLSLPTGLYKNGFGYYESGNSNINQQLANNGAGNHKTELLPLFARSTEIK